MAEELPSGTEMVATHTISSKKRPLKNDKLCLDDYIHLLHSRHAIDLTMNQLNQVIRIHGFKKIHHAPKKVLMDAVDTLDLLDLPRSTLSESVSAFADLTVEEAIADLADLNWQECCVTSIQKFGRCNDQRLCPASSDQNLGVVNHSRSQSYNHQTIRDETGGIIPETLKRRPEVMKMMPRRKRSDIHALHSSTSIVDSASLASC
ncbi:uncharacterized protein LOC127106117 isoform X2 [Lathyrus oleraceus]|uniref:uncharacterized protein LOC127106117 isoform X2 n=1 Tax=Pisum sativum TaxID=3888 RepID=UPI0021D37B62|nr:uncharacterized protein LOC127106117 isoform X2 [Pisum sativum]